jgi:hypothetical protein
MRLCWRSAFNGLSVAAALGLSTILLGADAGPNPAPDPAPRPAPPAAPPDAPPPATPARAAAAKPAAAPSAITIAIVRPGGVRADLNKWQIVDSQSGPVNYYTLQQEAGRSFIRGAYVPPNKKAVFGFELPDSARTKIRHLDWDWRPIQLPVQGDECTPAKGDSANVVYITWRRFLRWYSLKYVWSTTRPVGTVCDQRRNSFVAQDTVVLESGGPTGSWKHESLDLASEFRTHFKDNDVPPLMGIAIMTDGDQTQSHSTGDYTDFVFNP